MKSSCGQSSLCWALPALALCAFTVVKLQLFRGPAPETVVTSIPKAVPADAMEWTQVPF